MQLTAQTHNGRMSAVLEGETVADVFRKVAEFHDVFEVANACGKCNKDNIKFQVRNVDDNDYFELVCLDCWAKFQFGQHKKGGGLFPKRKDSEGKIRGTNGWTRYNKETQKEE